MSVMMATANNRIHPHKLMMYWAMGSITLMFAGWISAYMVRHAQGRWDNVHLPIAFWISSIAIITSSVTIHFATKAFKQRKFEQYKLLLTMTVVLGLAFVVLQILGFQTMYNQMGITLNGNNAAGEFTYVIPFVHGLHVVGGFLALLGVYLSTALRRRKRIYSSTGIELVGIYWHFVDALWIFIFLFLLYNQS